MSPSRTGGSAASALVVYATLSVMVTELASSARRKEPFARFRASKSVLPHMASTVVYGRKIAPDQDVRLVSERDSNKTEAVKEDSRLRSKKRKDDWKNNITLRN